MSDANNPALTREDIVGKTIKCVYRSEWDEDEDGYAGCSVFVELDDGVLFELPPNVEEALPIEKASPTDVALFQSDRPVQSVCCGKRIGEVVASEFWPSIGLLLEDGTILFTGESDFRRVGPCAANSRTSDDFRVSEYRTYWPK